MVEDGLRNPMLPVMVALLALSACALSPGQMREKPPAGTGVVAADSQVAAACIVRELERQYNTPHSVRTLADRPGVEILGTGDGTAAYVIDVAGGRAQYWANDNLVLRGVIETRIAAAIAACPP